MSRVAALCDVNLLLALVTDGHPHHAAAVQWIHTMSAGEARICRVAQLGLLRVLNNPAVMHEDALGADGCWEVWDRLLGDERIQFTRTEPIDLDATFARYTALESYSPRVWTDAYLAAYAYAAQLTFVTLDRAFARFPGLKCKLL